MCHVSHVTKIFFLNWKEWWSFSVEGLLLTGPTPSSFFQYPFLPEAVLRYIQYELEVANDRKFSISSFLNTTN